MAYFNTAANPSKWLLNEGEQKLKYQRESKNREIGLARMLLPGMRERRANLATDIANLRKRAENAEKSEIFGLVKDICDKTRAAEKLGAEIKKAEALVRDDDCIKAAIKKAKGHHTSGPTIPLQLMSV